MIVPPGTVIVAACWFIKHAVEFVAVVMRLYPDIPRPF